MEALVLVVFFALIMTLGWIFFDENDWGKSSNRSRLRPANCMAIPSMLSSAILKCCCILAVAIIYGGLAKGILATAGPSRGSAKRFYG